MMYLHPSRRRVVVLTSRSECYGRGEADRVSSLASAEAERAARVGIAQAMAIEEQVRAYGGPRYQLTQQVMARFAEAIQAAGVDIVPKVVIGGHDGREGSGEGAGSPLGGSVLEGLLTILLSDKLGVDLTSQPGEPSAAARVVREELERRLGAGDGKAA
jgi:hypothetical protein